MMHVPKRSISRKFMLAVMATTLAALLVMASAMVLYDIDTFRKGWVTDLSAQADVLARVSTSALAFNDMRAATENLEQMRARPNILAAALYGPDDALFARYANDPVMNVPDSAGPAEVRIDGNQVTIVKRISMNQEMLGSIFIAARYPLASRIESYLTMLAIVMAACLVFAALVSYWLQRAVTQPILLLTDAVGHVVDRRDFSMRVKKASEDEIGVLVDSFNSMLGELGDRAQALESSNLALQDETRERRDAEKALQVLNSTLEERIASRTRELEHAHDQLRQAQKMEAIGQLTGGIAHDFNNLLSGMSGNVEMMQLRLKRGQTDDLDRYVRSTMASIQRAAALTHRLLAFARRQTLDPKPTDVNQLVHSMEDLIRRTVGPEIRVDAECAPDLWHTLCDPNQLENALLNLAINSRDAMPQGGTFTIRTGNRPSIVMAVDVARDGTSHDFVAIEIADTGEGMTPDVLSRAFDPFFTTKPLGQGTGLGLSMIYGFVTQSGGDMRMTSEPGRGTTVTILLPRHRGEARSKADEAAPHDYSKAATRKTILVVDDEDTIRQNLCEMLEDLGYETTQAADGRSALRVLLSDASVDLLVTDVGLPNGMNGRQLADAARVRHPELQVLFITGYANTNLFGNEAMEHGMEVLTKPFTMEAFSKRVSGMLHSGSPA